MLVCCRRLLSITLPSGCRLGGRVVAGVVVVMGLLQPGQLTVKQRYDANVTLQPPLQ